MNPLLLINSCGWIIGPAILLATILACVICFRASRKSGSPWARRHVVSVSLLPLAVGICGAVYAFAVWQAAGIPRGDAQTIWWNLGKIILTGLLFTALPLCWSLMIVRGRREPGLS
ncbi:MAG: hypothetical protein K8T89_13210 [Planctomycetes bacterium]|nr:hypothetical protein [Planctomycetota bacterium]